MYGSKKQTQEIRALRKVGGKWLKERGRRLDFPRGTLRAKLDCHTTPSSRKWSLGRRGSLPEHYEIWANALKI